MPSEFDRLVAALKSADETSEQMDMAELGFTTRSTAAALRDASSGCPGHERCGLDEHERRAVELLISAAGESGDLQSAPHLLQLERFRFYTASLALERILAREVARHSQRCEPPQLDVVATAEAGLEDFVVFDAIDDRLIARRPTPTELKDLAYFYAAIADSGPPVGQSKDIFASFTSSPPASLRRAAASAQSSAARKDHLYALSDALEQADLVRAQSHAVAYLETLGFPDPIDARLEADQTWGGPRFAYVMRDLALVSEMVGEVEIAAELYRRANPGGGACGTSEDYRRGRQLRGLIRSAERSGQCRSVVAQRLLDWDHDFRRDDVPAVARYGPARLAEANWDVARLYRAALLTRNRDSDRAKLEQALRQLPAALARAAQTRLDEKGPEAWEHRVRAAEGLADVQGREALAHLVPLLRTGSLSLRRRTIEAIGAMGMRQWSGPCPPDQLGTFLGGVSSVWSRKVSPLGTTCQTQLDDATANDLARTIADQVDLQRPEIATAALEAVGQLAAPASRDDLKRWRSSTAKSARKACSGVETWSEACQNATELANAATSSWERWRSVVDPAPASDSD